MMLRRTALTLVLFALSIFSLSCQKESESIVSIALHPTNANILYVATYDVEWCLKQQKPDKRFTSC
jgi:hypothetical protein